MIIATGIPTKIIIIQVMGEDLHKQAKEDFFVVDSKIIC